MVTPASPQGSSTLDASPGPRSNARLEVKDLQTYFYTRRGVVKAVDGVSFTLEPGETLGLVGESGSGKSITCLSILRLVPEPAGRIVGGEVWLGDLDLLQVSRQEMQQIRGRHVSMVLQDPMTSLNPVFNVEKQVGEGAKYHLGMQGVGLKERVQQLLRWVRIPAPEVRANDYPHQMSGGMRQRIVGAIALSSEPSVLIADEPTTSLDVTIQAQYLRLLKDLQEEHRFSMIFVTHDFGIVARVCDRVAVMYAGKIVEMAPTQELFNSPKHPYAQALIQSLPDPDLEVEWLTTIPGQPPSLYDLPPGCPFAPRCAQAMDICREEYPPAFETGGTGPANSGSGNFGGAVASAVSHTAACWLYREDGK